MQRQPSTPNADTGQAVLELAQRLIAIPSENPAGNTVAMAEAARSALAHPHIDVQLHEPQPSAVSLVAVLRGAAPGPRVILNGHLDTFPVGRTEDWSVPPLAGLRDGDRIYGRGAGDMKAGVAVLIHVMRALADRQEALHGEVVLTLVADEESGGRYGTAWLIENLSHCRGDYVLNADAGHPRVVRYGEKGVLWLQLTSTGRASHGAHVHLGDNAIESMMAALQALFSLRSRTVPLDPQLRAGMLAAREVSESEGGAGEFDNLCSITVNAGAIEAGSVANLVPGHAQALVDIRYPPGLDSAGMQQWIGQALAAHPKVQWKVVPGSDTEPAFTPPDHLLVQAFVRHARRWAAPDAVANMRVGLTDARLFRHAGMPAVVYGPTAHRMGGPDEFVSAKEVLQVFQVHLAVASELLGLAA